MATHGLFGFEAAVNFLRPPLRRVLKLAIVALCGAGVSAASSVAEPLPKGGGFFKLGPTYKIMDQYYTPEDTFDMDVSGAASWYGVEVHGRKTANGEIFDMNALTAAHKTLPLPSYVYVTNTENGRRLLVRVNDRGPFVGDRMIDVSDRVAKLLGFFDRGLTNVRVEYAGPAPLDGDDSREHSFLAEQVAALDAASSSLELNKHPYLVAALNVRVGPGMHVSSDARAETANSHRLEPSLVGIVSQTRALKTVGARVKLETPQPVRLARVASTRRAQNDETSGYRAFDPCWTCLSRDQQ
jgi:rare lipoprotein A (peptidoglycan hydrolase)